MKHGEDLVPTYLDLLVYGVCSRKAESRRSDLRTICVQLVWCKRLKRGIDIVILRLAIFEMLYVSRCLNIVALNEAAELSKNTATTVHVNLLMVCYQM